MFPPLARHRHVVRGINRYAVVGKGFCKQSEMDKKDERRSNQGHMSETRGAYGGNLQSGTMHDTHSGAFQP